MLFIIGISAFETRAQIEAHCEIRANLIDTDPRGTNVRSGAGKTSSIIGNLSAERADVLTIVAARGGWVKLSNAEDEEGETIFDKGGWVFASLLGMTTSWNAGDKLKKGAHGLYVEPNAKSRMIVRLPPESHVTLVGCSGKWAKVRYGQKTGWLAPEAQCTNTRTNCS
jgi:SH3-like domain-containing protein